MTRITIERETLEQRIADYDSAAGNDGTLLSWNRAIGNILDLLRAALAAQPAPAAVPLTRPHCRECAKWAKAQADNKEWMDGVVRGREIVARLAAAENRMTDDLPPLSGLRPCLHQSPVP